MESTLTKPQIIAELLRSSHRDLSLYVPIGRKAAIEDPEFLAHLIAWNGKKGSIWDSKIALPVISLSVSYPDNLTENSLAHIVSLRDLRYQLRAWEFAKQLNIRGRRRRQLYDVTERYLRHLESNHRFWNRKALQFRSQLKRMYAMLRFKPSDWADRILFKQDYPENSVFYAVKNMTQMDDKAVAEAIIRYRIPYLVLVGAIGKRAENNQAMLMAITESMTPTQIITNTDMLKRLGVMNFPATRAVFEDKIDAGASSQAAFKATRAAETVTDERIQAKLQGAQERQIKAMQGVDGNWLILGDKSGSMERAIEKTRLVASTLAKLVSGEVHVVWFDQMPRHMDITGKTYDEILKLSQHVRSGGGTSIGCGLKYIMDRNISVDGIVIVSDGGEWQAPLFCDVYPRYTAWLTRDIPVYFYRVRGDDRDNLSDMVRRTQLDIQTYDIDHMDHYALSNLVSTMRSQRYGLIDEIYETPLLTINQTLGIKEAEEEIAHAYAD